MSQPTDDRKQPAQDANKPERPDRSEIEELNRQTMPRTPDGQVVDPKQEDVRDTAG